MYLFAQYPLEHFLALGAILFCAGIYTVLTRKNAVSILMGIELILNAACVNFIAFACYGRSPVSGTMFAIFIIVLAAAEAAVALAIVIGIYKNFGDVDVDNVGTMKE